MRREEVSFDELVKKPGVYYNPDEGVIIRVSRITPLLQHAEEMAVGKKAIGPSAAFIKISDDPGLNDEEVEAIIRQRRL